MQIKYTLYIHTYYNTKEKRKNIDQLLLYYMCLKKKKKKQFVYNLKRDKNNAIEEKSKINNYHNLNIQVVLI